MKMLTDKQVLEELIDIYEFERDVLLEKMDEIFLRSREVDQLNMKLDLDRVDDYIDFLERLLFQYSKVSGEGKALS